VIIKVKGLCADYGILLNIFNEDVISLETVHDIVLLSVFISNAVCW